MFRRCGRRESIPLRRSGRNNAPSSRVRAHTHVPRAVKVDDVTVVNPGSVGMPAYMDSNPTPHAIETGAPHARYAVATRGPTDKDAPLLKQQGTDPRPYSDAAARATSWVVPPEPRDAKEASQQISDYFDAVADMVRRLEEPNMGS